jgi:hypothetical protein
MNNYIATNIFLLPKPKYKLLKLDNYFLNQITKYLLI